MLLGQRINLKPIDEKDTEWLRTIRNKYRDNFFSSEEVTKEKQRIWYDKYTESKTDNMFIIELKNREKIGTIALYNISIADRTAELGRVLLLDEFIGKEYMQEAINLLVQHGFVVMRLFKIRVMTYLDNSKAMSLYLSSGFKTTNRPIILLEKVNETTNWKAPVRIESYDDETRESGHEGQCDNIK